MVAEHVTELPAEERVVGGDVDLGGVRAPDLGAEQLGHTGQLPCAPGEGDAVAHDDIGARRPQHPGRLGTASADGATRVSSTDVGTTSSVNSASSTSIGSATNTGPLGGVDAILIASATRAASRRIDHARRPLGDRPRHRDEVGGHLRVHRVERTPASPAITTSGALPRFAWYIIPIPLPSPTPVCSCTSVGFCGRAGVAVGDPDRDRLLQRRDVAHVGVLAERVEEPLLHRAGVAEHVRDPVGEQLLDDREPARLGSTVKPRSVRCADSARVEPPCLRPVSSTSTIFCPVRYESGVDRPVTNG